VFAYYGSCRSPFVLLFDSEPRSHHNILLGQGIYKSPVNPAIR
jgi:hypothetical protein